MKIIVLILICLASVVCAYPDTSVGQFDLGYEKTHRAIYEDSTSPSRRFVALSGIGLADVDPAFRMRVRIIVVDLAGPNLVELNPWVQREWVVAWAPNDVLVVCGLGDGDEGRAYTMRAYLFGAARLERPPTETEKAIVLNAFEKKYGHQVPSPPAEPPPGTPSARQEPRHP
jgi:hypothetical protein